MACMVWKGRKKCFWLDGLVVVCLGCGLDSRPKLMAAVHQQLHMVGSLLHLGVGNVAYL